MLGRGTAQVLRAEDYGGKDLGGGDTLRLSLEEWRSVLRQSVEKAAGAEGGGRRPLQASSGRRSHGRTAQAECQRDKGQLRAPLKGQVVWMSL